MVAVSRALAPTVEHNSQEKTVKARCRHCDQEMALLSWDMALALRHLQDLLDEQGWSVDRRGHRLCPLHRHRQNG
jgi:hypothetical protein